MTMRFSEANDGWARSGDKTSWNDLLNTSTDVDSGDVLRIVESVSGYSRGELTQFGQEFAPSVAVARISAMIARRSKGDPLQYVLGSWGFRKLDLFVDSRVLIPRPETEILAEVAIEAARQFSEPVVVDLGTGSGAVALSIASEVKGSQVVATDRSLEALEVARANLAGIGTSARQVQLLQGDWFEALPANLNGKVNVIVSNPPYISSSEALPDEVINFEPRDALIAGELGTECLSHIVETASDWLTPNGFVVLECAPHQTNFLVELASELGFDTEIIRDLAGKERVVRLKHT